MAIRKLQTDLLPKQKNSLAIILIILLLMTLINSMSLMFIAAKQNNIAAHKTTQVQLVNGSTFYVTEKEQLFRYPPVIKRFVSNWITLSFNWDGKIPGTNQVDKGVPVGKGNSKITTAANVATLMMEPRFAEASKPILAELTPPAVFSGGVQSTTIIRYISEPREIKVGTWNVDVLAERTEINQKSSASKPFPLNWTFTIKAVEIPKSAMGNNASIVEQRVYDFRSSGLEITQMVPFDPNQTSTQ